MTLIANPIYDSVFKYMMEDERVAKILLSALLKKEILELQVRPHEYANTQRSTISMFRMDFSARIRETDGEEHLVLIELQKTWLPSETLRFRQYLGVHYLSRENVRMKPDESFGLPIISIYILGHTLGDLKEPVIYVRRRYLDYDDNVIVGKDKFIESLTHDSIIVQVPFLRKERTRNRLERLLNIFNQDSRMAGNDHLLDIDETLFSAEDFPVLTRLFRAGATPDIRRDMDVEDEILSEIEARDTAILLKDKLIEQKSQEIEQKSQEIKQKSQEIEQKSQEIEQKSQEIEQQKVILRSTIKNLIDRNMSICEIANILSLPESSIQELLFE